MKQNTSHRENRCKELIKLINPSETDQEKKVK